MWIDGPCEGGRRTQGTWVRLLKVRDEGDTKFLSNTKVEQEGCDRENDVLMLLGRGFLGPTGNLGL